MAKVYSYLRFSDPKQAAGSSVDRQLAYAERWAAARGLALDESLSLRDEGLSAYHQKHVKSGALGVFLRAVEDGRVAPGSVLVVEGLDRLSRAEPLQAQAQLTQIIHAGITVVTAGDGQEYSLEGIRANPYQLIHSLVVMIRAHEESDTKSKRVRAAIRRQCEGWLAGTWRGIIRNGKDPQWLRQIGQTFEVIEARAEAIRFAAARYLEGYGARTVVSMMFERGLAYTDAGKPTSVHLHKTLRSRMLLGERALKVDGEEYRLPGYYPAIMTEAEWSELQVALTRRSRVRGPGVIPSMLTGLKITVCGDCGAGIINQTLLGRNRQPDGRVWPGHRRLNCAGAMSGRPCSGGPSIQAGPVERAILLYCADPTHLSALNGAGDGLAALRAEAATLRQRIADAEARLARLAAVIAEDDGATPLALIRSMREIEAAMASDRQALDLAEQEMAAWKPAPDAGAAERWLALIDGVDRQDVPALLQARETVRAQFERIRLWRSGTRPGDAEAGIVEMELTARRGGIVRLRIDKRSGAPVD